MNRGETYAAGNKGHRPSIKGGYFPVPPVDSLQNIRSAISMALEEMGVVGPDEGKGARDILQPEKTKKKK